MALKYLFAAITTITGGMAAWRWYQASKLEIEYPDPATLGEDTRGAANSLAESIALKRAAEFNKAAAIWTAVSVALTAASSFF